jgi:SOS-response transcriptional repressor LexA
MSDRSYSSPRYSVTRTLAAGREHRQQILEFIAAHQAEHGWAPTVREIGDAIGLGPGPTHGHLRTLHEEGKLVLGGGPRMIRLTSGDIRLR